MLEISEKPYLPKDHPCRAEVGDVIECLTDKLKYLVKGKFYLVEKTKQERHFAGNHRFKLKGINGFKTVDIQKFRALDGSIVRDLKIENILDETPSMVITTEKNTERKIDIIDKKYTLIELLINRMSRDKNNLGDYRSYKALVRTIVRGDKVYGITEEDFEILKDITVEEMFDYFIKTRLK